MTEYKGRGGWRGGGRPPLLHPGMSQKRPNHGMRAWPEEWKLITRFQKCVKKDIKLAEVYLKELEDEVYRVKPEPEPEDE